MTTILISLSHWGMHEVPATYAVREFIRTYCGDSTCAIEILEDDGPLPSPRAPDIIIIDDMGEVPNDAWSRKSDDDLIAAAPEEL